MNEPPKHPCFQFRLRTLMIVVALLAVPLGYVGWQAKVVRERKETAAEVESLGGMVFRASSIWFGEEEVTLTFGKFRFAPPYPSPPFLRSWLGDEAVLGVSLPDSTPRTTIERIRATFPEAQIVVEHPGHAQWP
jgi:hypothetical protein